MGPWLVTGFGAFLDVQDNPSGRLALAVDGALAGTTPVVGRVLPVSYRGSAEMTLAIAREIGARGVIGTGVARGRSGVWVEALGRRLCGATPDNDGLTLSSLGDGADLVAATLDPARFAALLGAQISQDAGGYVCNAWAWFVPQALSVPAVFVHLPAEGMDPATLLHALAALDDSGPPA